MELLESHEERKAQGNPACKKKWQMREENSRVVTSACNEAESVKGGTPWKPKEWGSTDQTSKSPQK